METIGIGLLGHGTVGSGVGALLRKNADDITLATGRTVVLRRVLELPGFTHPDLDPALVTSDFADIVDDPSIQVVVELIGGIAPARDFQLRALQRRQARRHRQQAAAQPARRRAARDGGGARRAPALRGELGRRRAHHQGAARVAGRGRDEDDLRHRQRHDQLHAERDDRERRRLRRRAQGGAAPGLRRGRPDRRRHRQGRGRQDGDHVVDRLPQPRQPRRRLARGRHAHHGRRHRSRPAHGLRRQAARRRQSSSTAA